MKTTKKILSILITTLLLFSLFGCGTEPKEHSTDFSDIENKWTLDSIYEDSHAKKISDETKTDMVLDESSMVVTVTKKEGSPTTTTYTISGVSDGKFTATSGDGTIEYTFNYDPGANLLHLYNTDSKGRTVHTVYREYSETLPWANEEKTDETKTNTESNTDETKTE